MRDRMCSPSPFSLDHNEFPLVLHIARGKTDFPDRPINETPFLIGGGEECHLRLGGGLPPVHSCILQDQETLLIECLAEGATLKVDSRVVRAAVLSPGSTIEIGPFQFELRKASVESRPGISFDLPLQRSTAAEAISAETVPGVDELVSDPKDLSIHGLIDRLESALEKLEGMEQRRRSGLASLLEKVMEVAADQAEDESPQRRSA